MSLHKERTTSSDVGGWQSGKCMIVKHFELAVDSLLHNSGLTIEIAKLHLKGKEFFGSRANFDKW